VTLRYGIVGAGVIAPLHVAAIEAVEDAELIGIGDADPARGCSFDELLARSPDVVVVCTPHPSHPPLAIAALEAGAHVLCEKPIAVETDAADAMIAAAERAGRLLGVCFQQRFRPVIARAHELIAAGELGSLVRVTVIDPLYRPEAYYGTAGWRGTWQGEGGGVLMNQAPHTLDLLCHLAGPPARVWGLARRRSQPMEAEDTAAALLEYANGAVGSLETSTVEAGVQRIELVGDRGRIVIVGETFAFERYEPPLSEHLATAQEMFSAPEIVAVEQPVDLGPGGDHVDVHRDFASAIRNGHEPRIPAREALWSLELANAIALSSHLDRSVELPLDRAAYSELLAALRSGDAAL
jgi:UDP-N-acetyl-2-amino-2-deoxyglucuronate dehydrogenase